MFVQFCVLIALIASGAHGFSCKNQLGNDIDWYAGYKLPRLEPEDGPNMLINGGALYVTDPDTPTWTLRAENVSSQTKHHLAQTLQPLFSDMANKEISFIIYNDELPNGSYTEKYAHSKGLIAFNETTGFWLVHSVPRFPGIKAYDYPHTGLYYGQGMLCVTFNVDQLQTIANQIYKNGPLVYSASISDTIESQVPLLNDIVSMRYSKAKPYNVVADLTSKGGLKLKHFAKSGLFEQDLYDDFVAPTLQTDLAVETWMHGYEPLFSNCTTPHHVFNVRNVSVPSVNFENYHDHSKWAVSLKNDVTYTCVGDINRMKTQFRRGGGTLCVQNPGLQKLFQQTAAKVWPCKPSPPPHMQ